MPKSIEDLMGSLNELATVQTKLSQAENQLQETQRTISVSLSDAEKQAREITDKATQDANAVRKTVEDREKAVAQRENDVASRESAVAWVNDKVKELQSQELVLQQQLKKTTVAEGEHKTAEQYWKSRNEELDVKASVLNDLDSKLKTWQERLTQGLPTDVIKAEAEALHP